MFLITYLIFRKRATTTLLTVSILIAYNVDLIPQFTAVWTIISGSISNWWIHLRIFFFFSTEVDNDEFRLMKKSKCYIPYWKCVLSLNSDLNQFTFLLKQILSTELQNDLAIRLIFDFVMSVQVSVHVINSIEMI